MAKLWAGVDAGKAYHHCMVVDGDGEPVLSRRVANDEQELLGLIGAVAALDGEEVVWAVDLNDGGAALLIALLTAHGQSLLYIPGRVVHGAASQYRGEAKTDAKDAFVIADQARMRRDLQPLRSGDEVSADLRLLVARRADLVADRTREINRLRATLLGFFPALERSFDYARSKAALVLLTGYQTPAAIRQAGAARLERWLRARKVRNATAVAATAAEAAQAQHTAVSGEQVAATMAARLATRVMALDGEISELDALVEARFRQHRHAELILSMPGFGPTLGAEFLAHTGGDLTAFGSVERLATAAGLAPVPRDSGRITGNLRRPKRYSRRLRRTLYLAAMSSIAWCPASKRYYSRKRAEGKHHIQAVLALARRRLNVLWAMLRDHTPYTVVTTTA